MAKTYLTCDACGIGMGPEFRTRDWEELKESVMVCPVCYARLVRQGFLYMGASPSGKHKVMYPTGERCFVSAMELDSLFEHMEV